MQSSYHETQGVNGDAQGDRRTNGETWQEIKMMEFGAEGMNPIQTEPEAEHAHPGAE